jgi:hypothetical protein
MSFVANRSMNPWFRLLTGAAGAAAFLVAGAVWAGDDASGSCPHAKAGAKKKTAASCPAKAKTEKAEAEKPAAEKPAATAPAETSGQAGLKAFIDPATGQLREPTPEEAAAASRTSRFARAAVTSEPKAVVHPNGTMSVELGEEYMNDVIVRKNPDGTLSTTCVPRSQREKALEQSATPAKAELEKE